jgi:hypothetical protein
MSLAQTRFTQARWSCLTPRILKKLYAFGTYHSWPNNFTSLNKKFSLVEARLLTKSMQSINFSYASDFAGIKHNYKSYLSSIYAWASHLGQGFLSGAIILCMCKMGSCSTYSAWWWFVGLWCVELLHAPMQLRYSTKLPEHKLSLILSRPTLSTGGNAQLSMWNRNIILSTSSTLNVSVSKYFESEKKGRSRTWWSWEGKTIQEMHAWSSPGLFVQDDFMLNAQ